MSHPSSAARAAPARVRYLALVRRPRGCVTMSSVGEVIWSTIAVLASIAICGGVAYFMFTGRHDRDREQEAREFFDQHGHWPDEDPAP